MGSETQDNLRTREGRRTSNPLQAAVLHSTVSCTFWNSSGALFWCWVPTHGNPSENDCCGVESSSRVVVFIVGDLEKNLRPVHSLHTVNTYQVNLLNVVNDDLQYLLVFHDFVMAARRRTCSTAQGL